jgi:chromosome segregation ATPase
MFSWLNQKKQISDLRQELDAMKRTVNTLEIEWSEMHDRIRRMLAKISRRQQREDEREDAQPVAGENGTPVAADVPSSLTPRQRAWQEHLLARRRTIGGE